MKYEEIKQVRLESYEIQAEEKTQCDAYRIPDHYDPVWRRCQKPSSYVIDGKNFCKVHAGKIALHILLGKDTSMLIANKTDGKSQLETDKKSILSGSKTGKECVDIANKLEKQHIELSERVPE